MGGRDGVERTGQTGQKGGQGCQQLWEKPTSLAVALPLWLAGPLGERRRMELAAGLDPQSVINWGLLFTREVRLIVLGREAVGETGVEGRARGEGGGRW